MPLEFHPALCPLAPPFLPCPPGGGVGGRWEAGSRFRIPKTPRCLPRTWGGGRRGWGRASSVPTSLRAGPPPTPSQPGAPPVPHPSPTPTPPQRDRRGWGSRPGPAVSTGVVGRADGLPVWGRRVLPLLCLQGPARPRSGRSTRPPLWGPFLRPLPGCEPITQPGIWRYSVHACVFGPSATRGLVP